MLCSAQQKNIAGQQSAIIKELQVISIIIMYMFESVGCKRKRDCPWIGIPLELKQQMYGPRVVGLIQTRQLQSCGSRATSEPRYS